MMFGNVLSWRDILLYQRWTVNIVQLQPNQALLLWFILYKCLQILTCDSPQYCLYINPIPTEGGRFGPEQPETGWHFHSFMTGVTKIFDFVYLSTCLVPVNLFLKKKLWNSEKLKNRNLLFWHQRVPSLLKSLTKLKNFGFFL